MGHGSGRSPHPGQISSCWILLATLWKPVLRSGDTVLIDEGRRRILDGKFYAIRVDDTILIKELELLVDGKIMIKSRNESHASYSVRREEVNINGQVIWFARTCL